MAVSSGWTRTGEPEGAAGSSLTINPGRTSLPEHHLHADQDATAAAGFAATGSGEHCRGEACRGRQNPARRVPACPRLSPPTPAAPPGHGGTRTGNGARRSAGTGTGSTVALGSCRGMSGPGTLIPTVRPTRAIREGIWEQERGLIGLVTAEAPPEKSALGLAGNPLPGLGARKARETFLSPPHLPHKLLCRGTACPNGSHQS